jgi:spermidine synthase
MDTETATESPWAGPLLIASIFAAAGSGLVYELVAGTLSSYLLGDSVTQFSLVIGLFLTAMGLGSFLSGKVTRNLPAWFVAVEIGAGLTGGLTPMVAFSAFAFTESYMAILIFCITIVGGLVGFEIPLVVRILREIESLKDALANVMAADYMGALVASVVFPFLLLPHLGLVRAGIFTGLVNILVAAFTLRVFQDRIGKQLKPLRLAVTLAAGILLAAFTLAPGVVSWLEAHLYQDEVILAQTTPLQRLVLTRWREDIRLYLNGHLQFSSVDEYRYHEALVHPAMSLAERRKRVLILGGGDGLAAREVLRYPEVEHIDLVDLDPVVTQLFSTREMLTALNKGSLKDPRVTVHNKDAMRFLEFSKKHWDVILVDLPDPSSPAIAKLYSNSFYRLAGRHLASGGILCTQSTSPFRSREAFWCIHHTIEAAEIYGSPTKHFRARGYHMVVPTFGTWGFILAGELLPDPSKIKLRLPMRFLNQDMLTSMFVFPSDMQSVKTPISRLNAPHVQDLYLKGYHKYLQ